MRYAPDQNLLFIHIPKSAGLTVKDAMDGWSRPLTPEVEADLGSGHSKPGESRFAGYGEHPEMGSIHVGHVPMALVRRHLPSTYAIMKQAKLFAVLRDPKDRFQSAVAQNLREYKDVGASQISDAMMRETGRVMMQKIAGMGLFADRHYIHFAPQSWFVEDPEAPLQVEMFATDHMDRLGDWLEELSGHPIAFGSRNQTVRPKSSFEKLHKVLTGLGGLLPKGLRSKLRPLVLKLPFYRKSSKGSDFLFDPEVETFIQQFYARDWELYRAALSASR